MRYKIKDLMINVLPSEGDAEVMGCGGCTQDVCSHNTWCHECTDETGWGCDVCTLPTGCKVCTDEPCTGGCSGYPSCGGGCSQMPTYLGQRQGMPGRRVHGGLGELKASLKQQLAEVEARESQAAQALTPSNVEEAEQIEEKLKDALAEVRRMKAQLKKAPKR